MTDNTSELYIYKVDSINLSVIEPHAHNPVMIDSRFGRNAGVIFKHNGKVYRPSQCNTHGIYGRALNINEICCLTIDDYKEETVRTIEPDFQSGYIGLHHLHQTEDFFVFDAKLNNN